MSFDPKDHSCNGPVNGFLQYDMGGEDTGIVLSYPTATTFAFLSGLSAVLYHVASTSHQHGKLCSIVAEALQSAW